MNLRQVPRAYVVVFLATFAAALLFAASTQHVWEDYYITYRASKNLATGHGLVFNAGDRLHTFTSPLGVLLPALSSALTLNRSDAIALWIFRLMSGAAFAGAVTLLYASALQWYRSAMLAAFAAALLAVDAKSLDFTINGMETGFLLLFIALTLWAQFGACSRRWLWLGLAWAGLMWTRPDGFLYIGLLSLGGWLFNDTERSGLTRAGWLKTFLLAGVLCTALYLPWFVFSWVYYGTPVPHTIMAKSGVSQHHTIAGAVEMLIKLPVRIWTADTSLPATFLPSYYVMGGWPAFLPSIAKSLATIVAFAWLLPFLSSVTRTASFTFCALHVYLSYYPYFPFPWYLPGTALLAYVVLSGVLTHAIGLAQRRRANGKMMFARWPTPAALIIALMIVSSAALTVAVARQVAAQQRWVEDGNRRKIGEWLHEHAAPGDTVFVEPLGYVGYFSGLKTFDFPGMSSLEMVKEIRRRGADWAGLIQALKPTWVILRPPERLAVTKSAPHLLVHSYDWKRDFSVRDDVSKLDVPGRTYLEFDSLFSVFHRRPTTKSVVAGEEMEGPYAPATTMVGQVGMQMLHAPSRIVVAVPAYAKSFKVGYGIPAHAYAEDPKTDGVTFIVEWEDDAHAETLLSRRLDPAVSPDDRGPQFFSAKLPARSAPIRLILTAVNGVTATKDFSSWSTPEFQSE